MLGLPVIFIWGSGEGRVCGAKKIPTATGGVLSGERLGYFKIHTGRMIIILITEIQTDLSGFGEGIG